MTQVNASGSLLGLNACMWHPILTAPFDCDVALALIDDDGVHALPVPCRREAHGWIKAESKERIDIRPTHWRTWTDVPRPPVAPARSAG